MEQPQTPDRADLIKTGPTGPTPSSAAITNGTPAEPTDLVVPPAVPLTPMAWLSQNAVYFIAFAAIIVAIYHYLGVDGIIKSALVALGLGFIVFIHELGHFLAAKWCDVHIQTFSLGFGPALPGCSFRRGETLYKIAVLPLGGYVAMVGEGVDADEDESYPRSFKNKTVGQRMLIISAGVVMNMIFACLCFIGVYYFHGVDQLKGVIGTVEAGSPAAKAGVRSFSRVKRVGGMENPSFADLQQRVSSTWFYTKIPFVFEPRPGWEDSQPLTVDLAPRRTANDAQPVIGVSPPYKLELPPAKIAKDVKLPVFYRSAAAQAREVGLPAGTAIQLAWVGKQFPTSPKSPRWTDLFHPSWDSLGLGNRDWLLHPSWDSVCQLMRQHPHDPITLVVTSKADDLEHSTNKVLIAADGFHFGDKLVGTTDDSQPEGGYDPFALKALPLDAFDPSGGKCDPFEFYKRTKRLAGRPMVIQVRRDGQPDDAAPVSILVPPAFTPKTGLVMEIGAVAAVRTDSPAAAAGVQEGDKITKVELLRAGSENDESQALFATPKVFDPAKLPFNLEQAAKKVPGKKVVRLTVHRSNPPPKEAAGGDVHRADSSVVLEPIPWDESWTYDIEIPSKPSDPLAIPELGIAYWISCRVADVEANSPAERAGILPGDRIADIRLRKASKKESEDGQWDDWIKLESSREDGQTAYDDWAYFSGDLLGDAFHQPDIQVKVFRDGKLVQAEGNKDREFELDEEFDESWPSNHLGFWFLPDTTKVKADSLWGALVLGANDTWNWIQRIYLGMRNLVTGRSDPKKNFGGPIAIANTAFIMADDPIAFILFMGAISINLAIVNFLPIPLLDGGHMVLLVYEKIRGKPPSDNWKNILTYIGLVIILAMMVTAFGLDIARWFKWL